MTGNEYQKAAMRTNDGKNKARLLVTMGVCDKAGIDLAGLLNGCLGIAGEAGELIDMVKKFTFHSANLDHEHLKKEVGDLAWYMAMICQSMGWDLDEILQMNVDKLKARYPEGFSTERSAHRAEGDV